MPEHVVQETRYSRFRRVTERRMVQSVTTKPQVTLHAHAALTSLERDLAGHRADQPGSGLGFTAALLAAIARGVAGSRVNGMVSDQVIALHDRVDLGVAVDVDGSLVVPVVRDADRRSVSDLGSEVARLAEAARAGTLRPDDVDGATFTVTSLGALGVELFTPIVNPPQLAILGLGAIRDEAQFVEGVIAPVRRIGLSLSFDHAATDGADAAKVLRSLAHIVESPSGLTWNDDAHEENHHTTAAFAANPT